MRLSIDKTINSILDKLDYSISELAKGALESSEFQIESNEVNFFLLNQYDIRLQNLLKSQDIDIHYLESGIKNRIIQRKQKIFEEIAPLFQD
jgi:hypothetical protein